MKKEIRKMVLRVMKTSLDPRATKSCRYCFVQGIREELNAARLYDYEEYDGSPCGRILFYLQEQGIIKILQGVPSRSGGVDCRRLKIKVLHPIEYNKI